MLVHIYFSVTLRIERELLNVQLCSKLYHVMKLMTSKQLDEVIVELRKHWNVASAEEVVRKGLWHAKRSTSYPEDERAGQVIGESYYALAKYCHEWKNALPGDLRF